MKNILFRQKLDFAIVYAPTESLYSELSSYQDPSTKELLTIVKSKVVILGLILFRYLQSLHMGFGLKFKKHATKF